MEFLIVDSNYTIDLQNSYNVFLCKNGITIQLPDISEQDYYTFTFKEIDQWASTIASFNDQYIYSSSFYSSLQFTTNSIRIVSYGGKWYVI